MKNTILFLLIAFCIPDATHARSSVAAADLTYTWLSDSTYRFVYKLYNNCSGGAEPDSVTMCIKNKCSTFNATIALKKLNFLPGSIPNGTDVFRPECTQQSTCTDPLSPIPGYREWWYYGVFTLPSRCTKWEFSVSVDRDSLVSNLAAIKNLWVDATLNNKDFPGASSPSFSVKPFAYVCNDAPYTYNNGAVSANGDSLYFQLEYSSQAALCSDTFGDPTSSDSFNNSNFNLFNNPFECHNTFSLNHRNGQMSFTVSGMQTAAVSMRCISYRNGKEVGHVTREIQLVTKDCSFHLPEIGGFKLLSGNLDSTGTFSTVAGSPINFSFLCSSAYPDARLILEDNHFAACNGCQMTYTNQYTDSLTATFLWTPTIADTGMHVLLVIPRDTVCRPIDIIVEEGLTIPIYVASSITGITKMVGSDNSIRVYPNPTTGIINLSLLNKVTKPVSVSITDAVGRAVLNTIILNENTQIDLSRYQNGLYFVHLSSDQLNYSTKVVLDR